MAQDETIQQLAQLIVAGEPINFLESLQEAMKSPSNNFKVMQQRLGEMFVNQVSNKQEPRQQIAVETDAHDDCALPTNRFPLQPAQPLCLDA